MSADSIVPIASRSEFQEAIRNAFVRARDEDAREILIVDENFVDWPLSDRAVLGALADWADARRSFTAFGHSFDELARRHARFLDWRRQWAHVVHCRHDPELEPEQLPSLLLVPGVVCVRLLDRIRHRGTSSDRPLELTEARETIDALLQRSVETFPVTTLGL
jgi:hypothetical protein